MVLGFSLCANAAVAPRNEPKKDSLMMDFEKRIEATALQLSNSRYDDQKQDSFCQRLVQMVDIFPMVVLVVMVLLG